MGDEKLIIIKNINQTSEAEYHMDRLEIPYKWSMAGGYLIPEKYFYDAVDLLLINHIDIGF